MPPKVKITKKDIVNTAVELVKKSGTQSINARNIASVLNCSTQPIFSNFKTMDDLKLEVLKKADELCQEYMQKEVERGEYPPYKANGMAYIRLAKEQKELFKFLFMRDRSNETFSDHSNLTDNMESLVHSNTGLDGDDKKLFHLEMWAYVHGIAVMFATDYVNLEWELVSKMLTDCYLGLKKQYGTE